MAISKSSTQVKWSTANSLSVSGSSSSESDAFTIGSTVVDGSVQLKADHSSSPGSGDYVDFYLLATNGDPDADPDSADEYDTTTQGAFLARLDCNVSDPAVKTVPLPTVAIKGGKIRAVNNAGEAVTVSAQLYLTTEA